MMTQETTPVKTWGGFNLAILKVNRIHYERIEVYTIRLRPLTSYCYLPVGNLLPRPRDSSEITDSFFP